MSFMKKIKSKALFLLSLILFVCVCFGVACVKPEEKIILLDEIDRPFAIVTREFDVMDIVEDTNGYELVLTECFYLNDEMQRVDIPFKGTKFTPMVEKEVFITLKIKKGKLIKEAIVKVEAPVSAIQEEFLSSWNDEGVGKEVTADQRFLLNGAESVVKVSYSGSIGTANSGPGIGGFYYDDKDVLPFSVTDWSNAVLTMDIYNPTSENLAIYYCIIKDRGTWTSPITGAYGQQRFALLKAGEWTQARLSLNMLGIDYNMYEKYTGNMYIAFRAAHEVIPAEKPYEWTMYIANMDIADYSAERFPGLETLRLDQKLDAMDGETIDKEAYKHLLEENTVASPVRGYTGIKTSGDIVAYESLNGVSNPNVDSGNYLNKYTITANPSDNDERGKLVYSTPLLFKNEGYFVLSDEQKEIDFTVAELTFDFYNPNNFDLPIYLVNMLDMYINISGYSVTAKAGEWTSVNFTLNHLTIGDTYTFAVSLGAIRTQYETIDYYIDNVKIVEGEPFVPVKNVTLSEVETTLLMGNYNYNTTNNIADVRGVSWLEVNNKDEKIDEGKNILQIKVSFTEFGSVPAYCHSAGISTYKFSWGYKHGDTTVFSWNDYSGGAIIGTTDGINAMPKDTSLKVYQENICVIKHVNANNYAWSYYSNVGNYALANGRLSTGVDYVFEYDLEKCEGEMLINFGTTAVIKSVSWLEEEGIQSPENPNPDLSQVDASDTEALKHLHAVGSNMWKDCTTTATIVKYSDLESIQKPSDIVGDTLIKYTFTSAGNWVNSLPLRFANGAEKAFDEEESTLDFTKAHISFYVYNPNGVDFTAYLAKSANGYFHTTNKVDSVAVKKGEWTKVDFSLTALNIDATGSYDVAIFMAASITAGAGATYYIDGVTIYEVQPTIPTETSTLSYVEYTIANGSNYEFNSTNIPVDVNGVSWLNVDNKDTKISEGKSVLKVTVNFTEFGTVPAYCHSLGVGTYKFSWGYCHGDTTVFSWNDYSSGAIIGSTNGVDPLPRDTGLKVYQGDTCVIKHVNANNYAWSYFSTAGNYATANGRLSTGVDYVFEFDLEKCTGELELNFGSSAIIKGIEWA